MKIHCYLAAAALAVIALCAGSRLRPPVAGVPRPCAHPSAVTFGGRTSALCNGAPAQRLPELAAPLGVTGCRDVVVHEGALLRLSDACDVVVQPMPAAMRLTLGLPLDINTSTVDELRTLPRIGPVLAARIVEHRRRHGPFPDVDSLRRVRGIGPRTVKRLDGLVTAAARQDEAAARYLPAETGRRQSPSK